MVTSVLGQVRRVGSIRLAHQRVFIVESWLAVIMADRNILSSTFRSLDHSNIHAHLSNRARQLVSAGSPETML